MRRAARIPVRQEGVPAPREMPALVSHAVHLGRPEDPHPRPDGGSAAQLCGLGAPARRRVSQGTPLQTYSGGGMHRQSPVVWRVGPGPWPHLESIAQGDGRDEGPHVRRVACGSTVHPLGRRPVQRREAAAGPAHGHPQGEGGDGGGRPGRLYTERVPGAPSEARGGRGRRLCVHGRPSLHAARSADPCLACRAGDEGGDAPHGAVVVLRPRHWRADKADTPTWDAAASWRTRA